MNEFTGDSGKVSSQRGKLSRKEGRKIRQQHVLFAPRKTTKGDDEKYRGETTRAGRTSTRSSQRWSREGPDPGGGGGGVESKLLVN